MEKKLSPQELNLVKERARNRLKEQLAYSIMFLLFSFVAPVFPFSRRVDRQFPTNSAEYFEMFSTYLIIISGLVILMWIRNDYINDIIFKKKVLKVGII